MSKSSKVVLLIEQTYLAGRNKFRTVLPGSVGRVIRSVRRDNQRVYYVKFEGHEAMPMFASEIAEIGRG